MPDHLTLDQLFIMELDESDRLYAEKNPKPEQLEMFDNKKGPGAQT